MVHQSKDPGFGYNSQKNIRGIINKDGSLNVIHINKKFNTNDLFTYFIDMPWYKLLLFVFLGYISLNILFGSIYVAIGIDQITPSKGNIFDDFLNGFFFSAQTLTTVGYGGIAPKSVTANIIAAFEAMVGLFSFSFFTGLLYGRFSRAKASILFSKNFIYRDFKKGKAVMFRLMNSRKTVMLEPEITVTLSVNEKKEDGSYSRNYYELSLERDKIMYLPTVWTIVHEIDEDSPLFKYSKIEIKNLDAKIYALLKYHEESFGQVVYQATSYDFSDLVSDVKYKRSSGFNEDGYTVLDHQKLSDVEEIN